MRMPPANRPWRCIKNIIHTLNRKRHLFGKFLERNQFAAVIAMRLKMNFLHIR